MHEPLNVFRCAVLGALVLTASTALAAEPSPGSSAPDATPEVTLGSVMSPEEAGRALGLALGVQMHDAGLADSIPKEAIERGLKEGLEGKVSSPDERDRLKNYMSVAMMIQAEKHAREATEFLAKNRSAAGVKTTASGLQYKVLKAGDPKAPAIGLKDLVTVTFQGRLLNGTEFDSSERHGSEPMKFPMRSVIRGWQEGFQLMKPGAHFQLFVPPDLGYGTFPRPGIPSNSLLIYDIDLVSARSFSAPNAASADPGTAATASRP